MSMRVHRYHMNGRIAAHSLVQVFAMLPLWVFDAVNAAMYVLMIALLYQISRWKESRSTLALLALFCGYWIFCPAFGQVNLWQDGACNYLWSTVFGLIYLLPFIELYRNGKTVKTAIGKLFFIFEAFLMGAYSETVSAAAIFMSMLLTGLVLLEKQKPKKVYYIGMLSAFAGYIFIYTAPAQWREKSAEMKISVLLENFVTAAKQYWHLLGALLVIFAVLLVLNLVLKTDRRRILLSLVFLAGSLAANFIMMFAGYYTTRSAIGACVFLLGAAGILLYPVAAAIRGKWMCLLLSAAIILGTIPSLTAGMQDIYVTYRKMIKNEAYLIQCAREGIMDVALPNIITETKYPAIDGLKYLDTEIADEWPNDSMSKFYGLHSITGYNPQ